METNIMKAVGDLPDEIAMAWAIVLLDIHEKRRGKDGVDQNEYGKDRQMPPHKIFGVGDLNIPGPTVEQVAAHVQALSTSGIPVPVKLVAKAIGCSTQTAESQLKLAGRIGLVRETSKGWIATGNG